MIPKQRALAEAGIWQTKTVHSRKHSLLQSLTIEDLLAGKKIDRPAQQDIGGKTAAAGHPLLQASPQGDAAIQGILILSLWYVIMVLLRR